MGIPGLVSIGWIYSAAVLGANPMRPDGLLDVHQSRLLGRLFGLRQRTSYGLKISRGIEAPAEVRTV